MKIHRIAVVGLGQIGGSLVLALRKTGLPFHITGVERNTERLRLMKRHLDLLLRNWKKLPEVDLIILCMHSRALIRYLNEASKETLLMDVCSAKQKVVALANRRKLRFIGSHPMAGNEYPGEKGWDRDLFHDAPFFLCPTPRVTQTEITRIKRWISHIGALPIEVDPVEHDRFVAMTSHFPAFLSRIWQQTTTTAPDIFKGPGYRSMSRLSKTSPELLETFLDTNRKNILRCAKTLQRRLNRWIKVLSAQC